MKYEGTKLPNFEPRTEQVKKLEIVDIEVGTGEEVRPGATITAHYTGALVKNGIIFQSSHDFGKAITFPLGGVIAGWTEGVPGMKIGGTRRLIIPADVFVTQTVTSISEPSICDLQWSNVTSGIFLALL